jgi:ribonuclease BN (tRNA processing enzyme)
VARAQLRPLAATAPAHHRRVGRGREAANVKTLILNHFVPPDDKSLTDQHWIDAVKITYQGNLVIGKDLLQLSI